MYQIIYNFITFSNKNLHSIYIYNNEHLYRYQENKLRIQRSLALKLMPKGNVRSKFASNTVEVDDTPLKKVRRKRHFKK